MIKDLLEIHKRYATDDSQIVIIVKTTQIRLLETWFGRSLDQEPITLYEGSNGILYFSNGLRYDKFNKDASPSYTQYGEDLVYEILD